MQISLVSPRDKPPRPWFLLERNLHLFTLKSGLKNTVAVFGAPCHSERSEESSKITLRVSALSKWMADRADSALHFVRNDKPRAISAIVFVKTPQRAIGEPTMGCPSGKVA
jgi:hypothetical protein